MKKEEMRKKQNNLLFAMKKQLKKEKELKLKEEKKRNKGRKKRDIAKRKFLNSQKFQACAGMLGFTGLYDFNGFPVFIGDILLSKSPSSCAYLCRYDSETEYFYFFRPGTIEKSDIFNEISSGLYVAGQNDEYKDLFLKKYGKNAENQRNNN